MRFFSLLFYLLIIIIGITFACLNAKTVTLHYYFGASELPLSIVLVVVFALGICMGLLSGFSTNIKLRLENRKLKKIIATHTINEQKV